MILKTLLAALALLAIPGVAADSLLDYVGDVGVEGGPGLPGGIGAGIGCEKEGENLACNGFVCDGDFRDDKVYSTGTGTTVGFGIDEDRKPTNGEYGPYTGVFVDVFGDCG